MTDVDILSIVEHRQWLVLAGALIMALVVTARAVAARLALAGTADRAVSVVAAYCQDLSWMLPAAGYDYWPWALLAALRGTLMSGGAAELLADVVRYLATRWHVALSAIILGGLLCGCGAENRCLAERSTVAALGIAAGMAEGLIPDTDEAHQAMDIATSSIEAGSALVSACEQLDEDARDWQGWLGVAVAAVKAVLGIIRAAGVAIPQAVDDSVARLEELLRDTAPAYLD